MTDRTDDLIGRRVREVRAVRGMSLRAVADLAGLSKSYVSLIERGERPVDRRSTLQQLANALRVAPSDLTGQPFTPADGTEASAHAAVDGVREVLRRIELDDLDETPDADGLAARVDAARDASVRCDLDALGATLPDLVMSTTSAAQAGSAQAVALRIPVMRMTFQLVKDLGFHDVAWIAVGHAHRAALAYGDPAWIALTQFDRARAMLGRNAPGAALSLVQRAADDLRKPKGPAAEAFGMLLLSAALQQAIMGNADAVPDLLDEASRVAEHTGDGSFGDMFFGPTNNSVWAVTLAVETGRLDRVPELAAKVDVGAITSRDRQAMFHVDHGRGLAMLRGREADAVHALSRGEAAAPQLVQANPYARETVAELLRRARRDTGGRELRALAHRMKLGT